MRKKIGGIAALILCTVIWGFAFVAQSVGMDSIGPMSFQALRAALAVAFLVPASFLLDPKGAGEWKNGKLWRSGLLCGCALFLAASLQQLALVDTDAGKAGFLTAMYIVIVPLLGLAFGQRLRRSALLSVALAVAGLYLLSCLGPAGIQRGDVLLIAAASAFAIQITLVNRLSAGLNSFRLNCIQSLTVCLLSLPWMLREAPTAAGIAQCRGALLFAGVLSMGVAYSLQIVGQKHVQPTAASLIMSLESAFAALGGWLLLGQGMTPTELVGCALMFAAVVLSQLPEPGAR